MRKLICDCCGEEIDTSYQDEFNMHPKAKLRVFDEVSPDKVGDLEYDLCINCTQKVMDCIKFNQDVAKSQ